MFPQLNLLLNLRGAYLFRIIWQLTCYGGSMKINLNLTVVFFYTYSHFLTQRWPELFLDCFLSDSYIALLYKNIFLRFHPSAGTQFPPFYPKQLCPSLYQLLPKGVHNWPRFLCP